jgi:cytochrome c oxidase subunit 2
MEKKSIANILAALLIVVGSGAASFASATPSSEKVIKVVSRRFVFEPAEITLKKGVPVVIEITTEDVVMGFSAPDLKQRADVLPKQVARVRFTPDKTGTYPFLCDIFCGSGHENMNGVIKVID